MQTINSDPKTPASSLTPLQTRSFEVRVYNDEAAVGEAAAALVGQQVATKPGTVLLLPTGRTPLIMYSHLVKWSQAGQLDLTQVSTFNLDEFYGLAAQHPGSYYTYMHQNLFDSVPIPAQNINLLNGAAPNAQAESAAYEGRMQQLGGIDLAVLGIGANGHIGFNEPGSELASRTREVSIYEQTRQANAFLFNDRLEDVPNSALTTGIATILEAKQILLLATGSSKAQAVAQLIAGAVSAQLPASFLRLHPAVVVLVDQAAAQEIAR